MSRSPEAVAALVIEAAGIVAACHGKVGIVKAMGLVGFSEEERKNMTIYQQVRRRSKKIAVVDIGIKAATPPESVNLSSALSQVSALSSDERGNTILASSSSGSRSSQSVRRRLLQGTTTPSPVSEDTTTTTGGNTSQGKKANKSPASKIGTKAIKFRRTSRDVQRKHAKEAQLTRADKEAMKQATTIVARAKKLPRNHSGKKSINEIVRETNERMGSNISAKTVGRYVRAGMINMSPLKRGPVGDFPPRIYKVLMGAYSTYLKLEQAGCKKQSSLKKMAERVNACVNEGGHSKSRDDLTRKLKKDTADQFTVGKANVQEARRLQWTTHYNLNVWFDTWKDTLIELKFAREATPEDKNNIGELVFFPGQLERIGNVDETDGSIDDTTGQRGGRPSMTFYSPDVSGGGTAANKSGYSPTIICGSNAAGDPFPPHFQLKTQAKIDENQRMSVDWFRNSKDVVAKFGHPERTAHPCSFGMNEKAGMNSIELDKYMVKAILPLYPDVEDRDGKRVLLKVDSGPGRMNIAMLANLQLQGVYLVPGVPNTTGKTQETDQNYGLFKSVYRSNLRELSQARFERSLSLVTTDLPLLVFGGKCPKTGIVLQDSFSSAFNIEANLSCWRKCGATPLTRSPLQSSAVRHEIAAGAAAVHKEGEPEGSDEPAITRLKTLESANKFYCEFLTSQGFDGSRLLKEAPRRLNFVAVTKPQSKERVLAIKKAKTAGAMFYATGGRHLNSNEFFKARKLAERDEEMEVLLKRKKERAKLIVDQREAVLILRKKGELTLKTMNMFSLAECKTLLKYRKGGPKPASLKKMDIIEAYTQAPKRKPTKVWSRGKEAQLQALKSMEVDLGDTALGVATQQMTRAVALNLDKLDSPARAELKRSLDEYQGEKIFGNL